MNLPEFNRRNIIKIKALAGALAITFTTVLASPGLIGLVHSDDGIITSDDIAAYNSSKYEDENKVAFNDNSNTKEDVFTGYDYIPQVTPDPEIDNSQEREELTNKMKEIVKNEPVIAPSTSKSTGKKSSSSKVKVVSTVPEYYDEPEIYEPEETPSPYIIIPDSEQYADIPEELRHVHIDDVERQTIYRMKFATENNVAVLAAVPYDEYAGRIQSVEILLLHNDVEIQRCNADDVENILKIFEIDMSEYGFYEVELYITLVNEEVQTIVSEETVEQPEEIYGPVLPEENEEVYGPVLQEENTEYSVEEVTEKTVVTNTFVVRQLSDVLYVFGDETVAEVVENPMVSETDEAEETPSEEEASDPTEEPVENDEEEYTVTEDIKFEEVADLPVEEPVPEDVPEEE